MKKSAMYAGSGKCVGFRHFSLNNRGEVDMVGFNPKKTDLEFLKELLLEHFEESELEYSDWAEGYVVRPKGSQWSWMTAYVAQGRRRYSLYVAIPDTWKGIDIEDEKPLVEKGLPGEIRSAIEAQIKALSETGEDFSGQDLLGLFLRDYDDREEVK